MLRTVRTMSMAVTSSQAASVRMPYLILLPSRSAADQHVGGVGPGPRARRRKAQVSRCRSHPGKRADDRHVVGEPVPDRGQVGEGDAVLALGHGAAGGDATGVGADAVRAD